MGNCKFLITKLMANFWYIYIITFNAMDIFYNVTCKEKKCCEIAQIKRN